MLPTTKLRRQRYEFENPIVVIRNIVQLLDVKVSEKEINKILYHPDYPSLSSVSDILKSWGIETFATKISSSQLAEISFPTIAHSQKYGGQFLILTELSGNLITYHDAEVGWVTESVDDFSHNWTGVILLLEAGERSGDVDFKENEKNVLIKSIRKIALISMLSTFVVSLMLYCYMTAGLTQLIYGIMLFAGVVVSALIVASELGGTITRAFCTVGRSMDCQSVLNSPASTLFGMIKISDVGIVWFSAFWVSWLLGIFTNTIDIVSGGLSLLSVCALSYVPFSIFYQWKIARKWCSLCLAAQVLLVSNAVALSGQLKNIKFHFSEMDGLLVILSAFFFVTTAWLFLKPLLVRSQKLEEYNKYLSTFKLDTELFRAVWEKQHPVSIFKYKKEIRLGSADAPLQLVLVASPSCESCAVTHFKLEKLYKQMDENVSIVMRFIVSPVDGSIPVAKHLYSLPEEQLQSALNKWFELRDFKKWSALFPAKVTEDAERIINEHQLWANWAKVTHTPTVFLNNRKIPSQYKIDDLAYQLLNFDPDRPIAASTDIDADKVVNATVL